MQILHIQLKTLLYLSQIVIPVIWAFHPKETKIPYLQRSPFYIKTRVYLTKDFNYGLNTLKYTIEILVDWILFYSLFKIMTTAGVLILWCLSQNALISFNLQLILDMVLSNPILHTYSPIHYSLNIFRPIGLFIKWIVLKLNPNWLSVTKKHIEFKDVFNNSTHICGIQDTNKPAYTALKNIYPTCPITMTHPLYDVVLYESGITFSASIWNTLYNQPEGSNKTLIDCPVSRTTTRSAIINTSISESRDQFSYFLYEQETQEISSEKFKTNIIRHLKTQKTNIKTLNDQINNRDIGALKILENIDSAIQKLSQ